MSFVLVPADTAFTSVPEAHGPFTNAADALDFRMKQEYPDDWALAPLLEPRQSDA